MKQLSLIIPMYNVAPYVERCIRSLEEQDIPKEDYELICVNDGSPDNCREIVEQLQQEFPNIILINQENQGVSVARNNALIQAKGNFVMAIDPDDYVVPNTFNQAIRKIVENELDVLFLGFIVLSKKEKKIWETDYHELKKEIISGESAYFALRGMGKREPDRSCAILFRKNLLDEYNVYYPNHVPYLEDGVFIGKVLMHAARVGFSNVGFYMRTTRAGSASSSEFVKSDKVAMGFVFAVKDLLKIKETKLERNKRLLLNHLIARYTLLVLMPSASNRDLTVFRKRIKLLHKHNLRRIDIKGVRKFIRLFSITYNISPYCYFFVVQMRLAYMKLRLKIRNY